MLDPALLDAPTSAPPTGPLADLILVRLLPEKGSLSEDRLRSQVGGLFPHPPTGEAFRETVVALRKIGLLTNRGQRLTETGRQRALGYLGIAELPPRANWESIQKRFLVPKALGLATGSDEAEHLAESKTFVARLVKREQGLPIGTSGTLNGVLEALVCRAFGLPEQTSQQAVLRALYARALGEPQPLSKEEAKKLLPRKLFGAKTDSPTAVRQALLKRLTAGPAISVVEPPPPPLETEPFDLEAFARTVLAAARLSPTGRFGENKVFINHVWRELADQPQIAPLGPTGFKSRLLEANRAGLLRLERCDLTHLEDSRDVRESRTEYLNTEFHSVRTEGV